MPKADLAEQLRALAEADLRTNPAKPKVDAMVQAIQHGKTLEQAAAARGHRREGSRSGTRLSGSANRAVRRRDGAAFVAPIGKAFGPFETPR